MIVSTINTIEGRRIFEHKGVAGDETAPYEARAIALYEMEEDVRPVGVDLDNENISTGGSGSMRIVSASSAAVVIE
jgi:uncharacterized protein YbjQ (UPF0145 family)